MRRQVADRIDEITGAQKSIEQYTDEARASAEIAQSASEAYPSKAAARDAIDKGTEKRPDFIVWGVIDGDIWTERYQNINGVATPTGMTMKSGKFIDLLAKPLVN